MTGGGRATWRPMALAMTVTIAVWVVLFAVRVGAHQPDVDDYLYASTAYHLAHPSVFGSLGRALRTGSTSPLVPLLAAVTFGADSVNGTTGVQLVFLVLTVGGLYALVRTWVSPVAAACIACLAGLNQAVLGFSVMVNFSVAVTAGMVWALVCYLRSDRLRCWGWSLGFGVSVAAVLLSRSLSPVYVAPLAVVVAADLVSDVLRDHRRPLGPIATSLLVILVVAGPWWLDSGGQALRYLTSAGYQASSGYTTGGAKLSLHRIEFRETYTLRDLGRTQRYAFWIAFGVAVLVVAARGRKTLRSRAWVPGAWSVLAFGILTTSANGGTGFGLPVLVVAIALIGVALSRLPRRLVLIASVAAAVTLAFGFAAELHGGDHQHWLGPPYRYEVLTAGGTSATNVDRINREVADAIGGRPTVIARADDILNINGIQWMRRDKESRILVVPAGDPTVETIAALSRADALVTGKTLAPFPPDVDEATVQVAAARDGFRAVRQWVVGPMNDIVLWERGAPGYPAVGTDLAPPTTRVLRPVAGAKVTGRVYVVAEASAPVGVASVTFSVSGPTLARQIVLKGEAFQYGWIGAWNTGAVPNGSYTVRSSATGMAGNTRVSAPVQVTVSH